MKKLMLLGGSAQQVIAIETAKRLGYVTILCDYLPENPGQHAADTFYLISTTDKEKVLQVALREQIDGVLAFASDPAAPTAAYVAECLGLSGNPAESVEKLCNKDKFRMFLESNGFAVPTWRAYDNPELAVRDIRSGEFHLPVMIKPVDSSGSKGVTVLHQADDATKAVSNAFHFSKGDRILVEEYIVRKHPFLIGGDIVVVDGQVVLWGLMNCHRDMAVNPLVPVGKSYPLLLGQEDIFAVQTTLQAIVTKLGLKNSAMNVELIIDGMGRVYPLDLGPRNGGNMIPDLLSLIFRVDVVEMSVKLAMGEQVNVSFSAAEPFYATHNLHADRDGCFQHVKISAELEKYMIRKIIYKHAGDKVKIFNDASKALGILFFKFDNEEQMYRMLGDINDHVTIILETEA